MWLRCVRWSAVESRAPVCGRPPSGQGWTARPPAAMSRPPRPKASRGRQVSALTDELVGAVVAAVRPTRPNGHGASWATLLARVEQIKKWVGGGDGHEPLSIVKIEELLARQGCAVPYRTLHRLRSSGAGSASSPRRCVSPMVSPGWRARSTSVRHEALLFRICNRACRAGFCVWTLPLHVLSPA